MDATTHKLYFPVADFQPGTKTQVPDSFKVLVYTFKINNMERRDL